MGAWQVACKMGPGQWGLLCGVAPLLVCAVGEEAGAQPGRGPAAEVGCCLGGISVMSGGVDWYCLG